MDDSSIVALYWVRDERALKETADKYGHYCWTISYNILKNRQDVEECVNDTYIRAWDTMPPQKPFSLCAYLGCIVRNLSINAYRARTAKKRGGHMTAVIDELLECAADGPEARLEAAELGRALNRFLRQLPQKDCCLFMRRYWYADSLQDIAMRYGCTVATVKSSLFRSRKKLKHYLQEEGLL